MFGKFYGRESYDIESSARGTLQNMNTPFCQCVLLTHFLLIWKGNTKLTSLLYFV